MFGYVKAYKPELRIKEYEAYKAVYCSLCKQLGKRYGFLMRFTLSYDFTFLALLNMSLSESSPEIKKGRCTCNPLKKCNFCKNCDEEFEFPAAVSVITVYYNILDNVCDEKGIKKAFYWFLSKLYSAAHKKAAGNYPEVEKCISEYIAAQAKLEKSGCDDMDKAAEPTSAALGKIFSMCGSASGDKRALTRLGYCLGKYIYLIDAADDLESDIKRGRYNPLSAYPDAQERAERNLYMCINESISAFELVDIMKFKNILGNIIYMGLEENIKILKSKKEKHK